MPAPRATPDNADPLVSALAQRMGATGLSNKTRQVFLYELRRLLAAAERNGFPPGAGLLELFRDEHALGLALIDERRADGGTHSRWTLSQRRTAVRKFAELMAPELRPQLHAEPLEVLNRALRRVAERVGSGYRLTGGRPRRFAGPIPTAEEVGAIVREAARSAGFQGKRNLAFFTVLYESGCRVNALRELRCDKVFALPSGHLRVMVHAKSRASEREIELSRHAGQCLHDYIEAFNGQAAKAGRTDRIELGGFGPLWRSSWTVQWGYRGASARFSEACLRAGVRAYTLHSFRRAFATEAAAILPRHTVAQAGGWKGRERMDKHYVTARDEAIAQKLWPNREASAPTSVPRDAAATL